MGAKKKSENSGSGAKGGTADDSGERLYRACRRSMIEYGASMPKKLEEKFLSIRDEKNPSFLTELVIWDNVGVLVLRAIADALRDTQYQHVQAIQCWKAGVEDEGVRAVTQFIRVCPTVSTLEFMDCLLTQLSCEFLSNTLLANLANLANPLAVLKLDHNNIGDSGVLHLAKALRLSSNLRVLSLSYCNLTIESGRALMEILIFQESILEELNLRGNLLQNEGTSRIFFGLRINKALNHLNLSDNDISDEGQIINDLIEMLKLNESLSKINLRFNKIYEKGCKILIDNLKMGPTKVNNTISEILLPEPNINEALLEELVSCLGSGNAKGKKGKKKKGKKKGKKK